MQMTMLMTKWPTLTPQSEVTTQNGMARAILALAREVTDGTVANMLKLMGEFESQCNRMSRAPYGHDFMYFQHDVGGALLGGALETLFGVNEELAIQCVESLLAADVYWTAYRWETKDRCVRNAYVVFMLHAPERLTKVVLGHATGGGPRRMYRLIARWPQWRSLLDVASLTAAIFPESDSGLCNDDTSISTRVIMLRLEQTPSIADCIAGRVAIGTALAAWIRAERQHGAAEVALHCLFYSHCSAWIKPICNLHGEQLIEYLLFIQRIRTVVRDETTRAGRYHHSMCCGRTWFDRCGLRPFFGFPDGETLSERQLQAMAMCQVTVAVQSRVYPRMADAYCRLFMPTIPMRIGYLPRAGNGRIKPGERVLVSVYCAAVHDAVPVLFGALKQLVYAYVWHTYDATGAVVVHRDDEAEASAVAQAPSVVGDLRPLADVLRGDYSDMPSSGTYETYAWDATKAWYTAVRRCLSDASDRLARAKRDDKSAARALDRKEQLVALRNAGLKPPRQQQQPHEKAAGLTAGAYSSRRKKSGCKRKASGGKAKDKAAPAAAAAAAANDDTETDIDVEVLKVVKRSRVSELVDAAKAGVRAAAVAASAASVASTAAEDAALALAVLANAAAQMSDDADTDADENTRMRDFMGVTHSASSVDHLL